MLKIYFFKNSFDNILYKLYYKQYILILKNYLNHKTHKIIDNNGRKAENAGY